MIIMSRFSLAIARICSAMWIGAALLFVLTSIMEQLEPAFDTATRDRLALIRFPWYYATGAVLLFASSIAALIASRGRMLTKIAVVLLLLAGSVMIVDYAFVYRPLRSRLSPPGIERFADFHQLHEWSEWLNSVGFLLTAASVVLLHATSDASNEKNE
jgi:hypothetical protein